MRFGTFLKMRELLGLAVLSWALGPTGALAYEFQIVAQPGDVIDGRTIYRFSPDENPIAISNNREVAFMASVDGPFNWSIMTPDRFIAGAGKIVDGVVPQFIDEDHRLSINDAGQVAYRGIFDGNAGSVGGGGIFVDDKIVAKVGDVILGATITAVAFGPRIINNGTVSFVARYDGHFGDALFIADGRIGDALDVQDELIREFGEQIGGRTIGSILLQQFHDDGTIAFSSGIPGPNNFGVFTQNELLVESAHIALDGSAVVPQSIIEGRVIAGGLQTIGISDEGEVAYEAGVVAPSPPERLLNLGVYTQDRVLVEDYDVVGGKRIFLRGGFQFNGAGMLSFLADTPDGKGGFVNGLFVDDQFVVGVGDIIGERVVSDIHDIVAMNDRGDLAFLAYFENASPAIVMATVPEPSTLMSLLTGLSSWVCTGLRVKCTAA